MGDGVVVDTLDGNCGRAQCRLDLVVQLQSRSTTLRRFQSICETLKNKSGATYQIAELGRATSKDQDDAFATAASILVRSEAGRLPCLKITKPIGGPIDVDGAGDDTRHQGQSQKRRKGELHVDGY